MQCVLMIIIHENEILLQKRDAIEGIRYPGYWAIPGGAVENDETILDALKREANEEISFKSSTVKEALHFNYCTSMKNEWYGDEYIFIAFVQSKNLYCIEGQYSSFFKISSLPEPIPLHHQIALEHAKRFLENTNPCHEIIFTQEGNTMGSTAKDFVWVEKLGTEKNPKGLEEKGKGYRVLKEGALTVLYHNGDPMQFLGYIEFGSNKTRGDHFHQRKVENMCVISGTIRAKYFLPNLPDDLLEMTLVPGDIVHILPGCAHSYKSDVGAVALEFSPQKFELSDTIDIDCPW